MGTHLYVNPGPRDTRTQTSIDGVVRIPVTTSVELCDGTDHVQLQFTDIDTLDETCRLLEQARAEHVAALMEGRSEIVEVHDLGEDDLIVLHGELLLVESVAICGEHGEDVIIRYGFRKHQGTWDMTDTRSMTVARTLRVKRLRAELPLTVVR